MASLFLLLVVLAGWVAAPIVHEIEHALERAELVHEHEETDGVSLRGGCEAFPEIAEECPINLTHVQVIGATHPAGGVVTSSDVSWIAASDSDFTRSENSRFVRGPPVLA